MNLTKDKVTDQPMPLIILHQAEKRYGKNRVLRVDSFGLSRHDFITIVGPNGAGKTTFLKILSGLLKPSRGRRSTDPDFNKQRFCFVPQEGGLCHSLSILENIELWSYMYGTSFSEDISENTLIQETGMDCHLNKPIRNLSGGYQKIAAIACALSVQPDGLFVDEPFSGLDEQKQEVLMYRFFEYASTHSFIVMTNHEPTILSHKTNTIHLSEGVIA